MKILVTGAAGFIGYNLSKLLLEKNHEIFGIDNFDNYYSIKFKKKRIILL
jgi:UDP-glucuronate 4-epimerase